MLCIEVKVTNFSFKNYFSVCVLILVTVSHSDLAHYVNGTNMSVEHLADILSEKTRSSSWAAVLKALVTVHHLMVHGDEVSAPHSQPLIISSLLLRRTVSAQLPNILCMSRRIVCYSVTSGGRETQ